MPGVVMDTANIGGQVEVSGRDSQNGTSYPAGEKFSSKGSAVPQNGSYHANGLEKGSVYRPDASTVLSAIGKRGELPGLPHVMQGFFPFSTLINRSAQQCWNDLLEIITELAEIQVAPLESVYASVPIMGKSPGNQSSENIQKKLRLLEFAHAKRAEFIKLLVLSQWGRQAADVSKLIDIQNFIRIRHQAYTGALQWVGEMKKDLVRAQVANPDIRTSLEVLSKGKLASMFDLGYKPPKNLTPRRTLRKLHKINRLLSTRLALYDELPPSFQTYRIHDGRVTFIVPAEFELDLSIGEGTGLSQFYFVDIRFLFRPSSPIPRGRIFNELELKVNDVLQKRGLPGCFDFLHNLVLTNKINILFKQATEMARGLWADVLRIELLHRTVVVHYWARKPGNKSWVEVGINSGRRGPRNGVSMPPFLGLRWMRDGEEVVPRQIHFDTADLSMERLLRSTIALHMSHIISSAYHSISRSLLYSTSLLSLQAQLTTTEPGNCRLEVQLTETRYLRVSVEPMSGTNVFSTTPIILERIETERPADKSTVDDIVTRVARLRCVAAIEEVECYLQMLGFDVMNPKILKIDVRKVFPPNVLRCSFFSNRFWERRWIVAATSSMDGDSWWLVQLRPGVVARRHLTYDLNLGSQPAFHVAQVVSNTLFLPRFERNYVSLADLGHSLAGILTIYANSRFLADLGAIQAYPPIHKLKIDACSRFPDIFIRYESAKLPSAFRLVLPAGIRKQHFIKQTIRLTFLGIDSHTNLAIVGAYGRLNIPVKAFGALISKWDRSLVFQESHDGFSIRLFAPTGRPVIINLMENLQRLECVLSILDSLQQKKIEVTAISLEGISFTYGARKDLSARLEIAIQKNPSFSEMDAAELASSSDSIFHLQLGIRFDSTNPHRRIQGALASSLNRATTDVSMETIAELLATTLPLMRALDDLMDNTSRNESLQVQVTVRNAMTYTIHYPNANLYFRLVARIRSNRPVWVLRHVDNSEPSSDQAKHMCNIQQLLYDAKSDDWRGIGNGVIARVDRIGILLKELHNCITASISESPLDKDSVRGQSDSKFTQPAPLNAAAPMVVTASAQQESSHATPLQERSFQHSESVTSNTADVIMID
ncbi:mediator of RNA polymerase II transcription subunit 14 [Aspergillus saccharolyticus JOP 1030-1]|uniref:Mediator of RNA polymerase II transcription subunit 14 n=1 Tax=Aspergillus saccharolyticus JOP 1030-1 TaxID=1450539 RepID=A0A318ZJL1_9EURO|nr:mediator of RNA polymerase II transcription subunit 14 [Aspergillus saccharolyticus JOP 1030-1]PYH47719.1 mediator of RNA polymerase II transcription subunit 14 [Aspergillus saccharolyticus JOP 1030-1]